MRQLIYAFGTGLLGTVKTGTASEVCDVGRLMHGGLCMLSRSLSQRLPWSTISKRSDSASSNWLQTESAAQAAGEVACYAPVMLWAMPEAITSAFGAYWRLGCTSSPKALAFNSKAVLKRFACRTFWHASFLSGTYCCILRLLHCSFGGLLHLAL